MVHAAGCGAHGTGQTCERTACGGWQISAGRDFRRDFRHWDDDRAGSVLEHADPADPGSVTDAFERLAAELLDYVHANQRLYHVLFHEAPGHQEQAREPLRHLVADLLSQAMDQGALTPTDAGVLAGFLLDGLHGAMLPLAHQDQPRVPASVGEILRRLLAPARPAPRTFTPGPAQP